MTGPSNDNIIENLEFMDVKIAVPWGHLVGRWFGERKVRPILALHGWLDNMGTWNNLIPLLPKHLGVLCLDLPGHGFSSKLPSGIMYNAVDYIGIVVRIMKEYNWSKVSLLAHSMSAMLSFIFTAVHPERVDMLISIDIVHPEFYSPSKQIEDMHTFIEKYMMEDERLKKVDLREPPSYTIDELTHLQYIGSNRSVELNNCHHIYERNIVKSALYPDKYYFARDGRIKYYYRFIVSAPFGAAMASRIKDIPFLAIKGSQSDFIGEQSKEVIDILRKNNPHFELHEVAGTHHVHLNNALKVAEIVNPFIYHNRPPSMGSWSMDDEAKSVTKEANPTNRILCCFKRHQTQYQKERSLEQQQKENK